MAENFRLEFKSRYFKEQGCVSNYFVVLCTQVKNSETNQSTIYWELAREWHYEDIKFVTVGPTTLTIGGNKVYSEKRKDKSTETFPCAPGEVTGSFVVKHNADGTLSLPVSLSTAVHYTDTETASEVWTLSPIQKVSTVTQNPAEIGDTAVCVINADDTVYTHDVTYTFGELSGTVVSGVRGGSYTWTFPDTFYSQITDEETSKTGTLTCTTYLNGEVTGTSTCEFVATVNRGMPPILSVTLEDTDATTVTLTGDKTKMIQGFSDISYAITATPRNGAKLASVSATNGIVTYATETGKFTNSKTIQYTFYATDSRGLQSRYSTIIPAVNYSKPSINISDINFGTDGKLVFNISGLWWDNSFGAKSNSVTARYRYKANDGDWSAWKVSHIVDNNTGKYANGVQITGLDYRKKHIIQAQIKDLLQTVETPEIVVAAIPVFDWSETDFNFNVPVNFSAGIAGGITAEDIDGAGLRYGTCDTGSSTSAKVVVSPGFKLFEGASIRVYFSSANTMAAPTLNVNNTGAKTIKASAGGMAYKWYDGSVLDFMYDGSYWIMVDGAVATTSYYGKTILTNTLSNNTEMAITPYGVQQAIASVNNVTATTSRYGKTILTNTIDNSTDKAVTPKGVQDAINAATSGGFTYGNWTPVLAGAKSYSSRQGWYAKNDKIVIIGFYISARTNSGLGNTILSITGVPFMASHDAVGNGLLDNYKADTMKLCGFLSNSSYYAQEVVSQVFSGWEISSETITAYGSGIFSPGQYCLYVPENDSISLSGTICYQTNS